MALTLSETFYVTLFVETDTRRSGVRPVASAEIPECDIIIKQNPKRVSEDMLVNTERLVFDIDVPDTDELTSHFEVVYPDGRLHTIDWDDGPWFGSDFEHAEKVLMEEYDRVELAAGELRIPENP